MSNPPVSAAECEDGMKGGVERGSLQLYGMHLYSQRIYALNIKLFISAYRIQDCVMLLLSSNSREGKEVFHMTNSLSAQRDGH